MKRDATERIREAISSQDYATALNLWNDYASQLREELDRPALSAERMSEVRELFNWARETLLCARAQSRDRLNAMHVAGAYANMGAVL